MDSPVPPRFSRPEARERIALIASSYRRLIGKPLVPRSGDPVAALWNAPLAVVAHGTEPDPLFFFASRAALLAFAATLDQFIGMPSRLSAEAPDRAERQALLNRVSAHGFIDDYAGMRVKLDGERFRIAGATVWNLIDAAGEHRGQAAAFAGASPNLGDCPYERADRPYAPSPPRPSSHCQRAHDVGQHLDRDQQGQRADRHAHGQRDRAGECR